METGRQTPTNSTIMAADQKSYNCQEGSRISAADNYITFQDNIVFCQEGV